MSLKIKSREKEAGVYVLALCGEVNTDTSADLEKEINKVLAHTSKALILDLKEMDYISSMGLSVFFRAKQALAEKKAAFFLTGVQPRVQKVFEAVKVLPECMVASLEQADECLDAFLDGIQKGRIDPKPPKEF